MSWKTVAAGMWPTMITAFGDDGRLDFKANAALADWLITKGAHGLFAVCQSSEMFFLTLQEKVDLAECVVQAAAGRVPVIASGHTSDTISGQIEELGRMAETGIDALVLVSNRLATREQDKEILLGNLATVSKAVPDITLGVYECPFPFLRMLSLEELSVLSTNRQVKFLKDVSCNAAIQQERARSVRDSGLGLYNAHEETIDNALDHGYRGYSGIMGNYHIDIYRWYYDNRTSRPVEAAEVLDWLRKVKTLHKDAYPMSAKYHLNLEGVSFPLITRWKNRELLTPDIMKAMVALKTEEDRMRRELGI
jgi:4-hydroxy-tetrahydrodipicolinate synthase